MYKCVCFAVLLSFILCGAALAETNCTITTKNTKVHYTVKVADTEAAREHGLMGVTYLAPDAGMLFVFDAPRLAAFWMRGTLIPLDMLFITADGVIADIHAGAKPHDETPIRASVPVLSVLEIAGGMAKKQHISVGDRVFCDSARKGLETN